MVALTKDETIRQLVADIGASTGWRADVVPDVSSFFTRLGPQTALALVDEAAGGPGYVSLIKRARKTAATIDAVVVGGPKSDEVLSDERSEGVDQYYERPIDEALLGSSLRHHMKLLELKEEGGIVGRSVVMQEILEAILQVGPTEVPILIEGESGTGKDVIARSVHLASRRKEKPFEAVNCGALAEGVLESELFGHERGAFTGAVSRRAGMFERANGGTIFLDEVGETSPNMQVRLLRVLESGEVLRVGGVESFRVDVRVIAATNRSLAEAVRSGSFRQDLYYRLKGINLHLPPLRDRREDIPQLVAHFVSISNRRHKKSIRGFEPAAMRRLIDYTWPGNIRELKNTIDTVVVLSGAPRISESLVATHLVEGDAIQGAAERQAFLPVALHRSKEEAEREMIYASILALHRDVREILALLRENQAAPWDGLKEVRAEPLRDEPAVNLAQMERTAIKDALATYSGNRRKAAEALGISERTLYRKIKEYGLV